MVSSIIKENKAYQYAQRCVDDNTKLVGKYVKKQAKEFLDSIENEDSNDKEEDKLISFPFVKKSFLDMKDSFIYLKNE